MNYNYKSRTPLQVSPPPAVIKLSFQQNLIKVNEFLKYKYFPEVLRMSLNALKS